MLQSQNLVKESEKHYENANSNLKRKSESRDFFSSSMVSINPRSTQGFPISDPVNMTCLPGFNAAAPVSSSGRSNTMPFSEDPTKKIRKPYTIKKSRENWTDQEHEKFLEALHLFDRDWKKIEAFVGSKTVVQIRSHAQKYFLKVQKNGINEHLPPPRPKRKANHPYPQKASKNVALTGSLPSSNAQSLLPNPAICTSSSSSSSRNHESTNPLKPVIEVEKPGVSATSLPTVKETNSGESCEKPHKVRPNFAEVYRFIGSVFDPNTRGHLQRLKQMDPINMETVLLLMRNLTVNLTSPEFAEQRRLISSYKQ